MEKYIECTQILISIYFQCNYFVACIINYDICFLFSFWKMDELILMINQRIIKKVIANDFGRERGRDFPQCKIQTHTLITFTATKRAQQCSNSLRINIHTYIFYLTHYAFTVFKRYTNYRIMLKIVNYDLQNTGSC